MTLEGPDGKRYFVDRDGRLLDEDYEGPAIRIVDGERVMVREHLDPASARIVDALVAASRD